MDFRVFGCFWISGIWCDTPKMRGYHTIWRVGRYHGYHDITHDTTQGGVGGNTYPSMVSAISCGSRGDLDPVHNTPKWVILAIPPLTINGGTFGRWTSARYLPIDLFYHQLMGELLVILGVFHPKMGILGVLI